MINYVPICVLERSYITPLQLKLAQVAIKAHASNMCGFEQIYFVVASRTFLSVAKWNESGFRPPLCTYRLDWARRTSWGWWDEMTLSSRHRIRISSPGDLRPSNLPLGHGGSPQYWLSHVDGEETFLFLSNRRDREPNPELWRGSIVVYYVVWEYMLYRVGRLTY